MKPQCQQNLCIYNNKNHCVLKSVSINEIGLCEDCILVEIDSTLIETNKKKQLENIIKRF